MCDFSLQAKKSIPAKVGDVLVTYDFGTGTRGFALADDPGVKGHCCDTAVCLLPGTEIVFEHGMTAIFRQLHKDNPRMHHDALEFANGTVELLTGQVSGRRATVLQLPAKPRNKAEREEQKRAEFIG